MQLQSRDAYIFTIMQNEKGGSERLRNCAEVTQQMGQGGGILTQAFGRLDLGPEGHPSRVGREPLRGSTDSGTKRGLTGVYVCGRGTPETSSSFCVSGSPH